MKKLFRSKREADKVAKERGHNVYRVGGKDGKNRKYLVCSEFEWLNR